MKEFTLICIVAFLGAILSSCATGVGPPETTQRDQPPPPIPPLTAPN